MGSLLPFQLLLNFPKKLLLQGVPLRDFLPGGLAKVLFSIKLFNFIQDCCFLRFRISKIGLCICSCSIDVCESNEVKVYAMLVGWRLSDFNAIIEGDSFASIQ